MPVELILSFASRLGRSASIRRTLTAVGTLVAAAIVLPSAARAQATEVMPAHPDAVVDEQVESTDSRFHFSIGADYTTAYFFRGFAYEDSGLIIQPWADLALDVYRSESAAFAIELGTWNSFQGEATDAGTTDDFRKYWYESDIFIGLSCEFGAWTIGAGYSWYTSPSDAFDTTEEVALSVEFDDESLLEGWTLQPQVLLAIETGSVANDGGRKGTYLQLGLSPGFEFDLGSLKELDLRFPLELGLSLSNYYEGEDGENDVFGFASVGSTLTLPLGLDESWGDWSLQAGVKCLFLGDVTAEVNGGDDVQFIATVGISIEF